MGPGFSSVLFDPPSQEIWNTDGIPYHEALPPLVQFLGQWPAVEHNADSSEIYLYHGTNCFRRWEINRSGNIDPGRSGYSFYTADQHTAYAYARAACRRDIGPGVANSLTAEAVVIKVRFTARTWMQADFVQEMPSGPSEELTELSVAVLGPIPCSHIIEVFHCSHEGRLASNTPLTSPVRTFADGSLRQGIRRLRCKTGHFRLDAYLLLYLGIWWRKLMTCTLGKKPLEVTASDELRRLYRVPTRH